MKQEATWVKKICRNILYSTWSIRGTLQFVSWLSPELKPGPLVSLCEWEGRCSVLLEDRIGLASSRGPTGGDGRLRKSRAEEGPPGCRCGWCTWQVTLVDWMLAHRGPIPNCLLQQNNMQKLYNSLLLATMIFLLLEKIAPYRTLYHLYIWTLESIQYMLSTQLILRSE
jgi:hypothetical protein